MTEERKPLSIFSYLSPLNKVFVDASGKAQYTVIEIPKGRFV